MAAPPRSASNAADKIELVERVRATIACDFADLALIKARLTAHGVMIAGESFTDTGAVLTIDLRKDVADEMLVLVADISRGKAIVSMEN